MGIAPSRLAAYEALGRIRSGSVDLSDALVSTRKRLADERDQALAAEILTGTERWRSALDFLIQRYSGRPLSRLDVEVVDVLRMSGYQLLHLDRVPVAAVVNDAVELTRRAGKSSAAGLVNAVLRAIGRDREHLPLPRRPATAGPSGTAGDRPAQLDYLAVTLSHPRWLVDRWSDRYGFEAAADWASFNNMPAPLTLRANSLRLSRQDLTVALDGHGVTAVPTRYAPDGLIVTAGNPLKTPLARSGLFYVQDEASQLVALVAGAKPGSHVLDCCAAPGGKTTAMAGAMADTGLLVASDVRRRRIALLKRTVVESGASCVRIVQADFRVAAPCRPVFDLVLVDAPCSGLGTLRRDPDLRWRRTENDLAKFAAAQQLMLAAASEVVRPGGRLVYATCSSEPEENESIIRAFLAAHPSFRPFDLRDAVHPLAGQLAGLITGEGHLRTYPHVHGLEAFFAAGVSRVTA